MNFTSDQLQLIRLLCDISIKSLDYPELGQVNKLLEDVEDFLFNQQNTGKSV